MQIGYHIQELLSRMTLDSSHLILVLQAPQRKLAKKKKKGKKILLYEFNIKMERRKQETGFNIYFI